MACAGCRRIAIHPIPNRGRVDGNRRPVGHLASGLRQTDTRRGIVHGQTRLLAYWYAGSQHRLPRFGDQRLFELALQLVIFALFHILDSLQL